MPERVPHSLPCSPEDSAAGELRRARERPRRIVLVDDEPLVLRSMKRSLEHEGYQVATASSASEALEWLERGEVPDVLVADQRMPDLRGSELLARVRSRWPGVVRLCMSGVADRLEILEAINDGNVFRFLVKPWTSEVLRQTLADAMREADTHKERAVLEVALRAQNQCLAELVAERTRVLEAQASRLDAAMMDTVHALVFAIEAKDRYTAGHSELVSRFGVALGERVGLSGADLECLRLGGLLHDVGKIAVPDAVLLKPGKLTAEEYDAVKVHPLAGLRLEPLQFPHDVLPIVRSHHERWDGQGYPDGLAGEAIPRLARLTQIVDVYEAVTARRVYRMPMPKERVVEMFERERGTAFDPELTPVFLEMLREGVFERIRTDAGLDIVQEMGRHTFSEAPKVELRED